MSRDALHSDELKLPAHGRRGEIVGERVGFLKLLFRRRDMGLLGVHVISEHATELAHLGLLAMLVEGGSQLFTQACFNLPTLGDLYRIATYKALLAHQRTETVMASLATAA